MKKETKEEALRRLAGEYADARTELEYGSVFELLVAVILSAQCTDKRVNLITKELFSVMNTPRQFATLEPEELEPYIKSCGLYRAKAKNIVEMSRVLTERYGGEVPSDLSALRELPGVGRKTANVVAAVGFGQPAIAVDTHVFRVANRIGLTEAKDVLHTEEQLMELIPKEKWGDYHHRILWHGRRVCAARNPRCGECVLADICDRNGLT